MPIIDRRVLAEAAFAASPEGKMQKNFTEVKGKALFLRIIDETLLVAFAKCRGQPAEDNPQKHGGKNTCIKFKMMSFLLINR